MISLLLIDVQGLPQRSWQTHVFCLHERLLEGGMGTAWAVSGRALSTCKEGLSPFALTMPDPEKICSTARAFVKDCSLILPVAVSPYRAPLEISAVQEMLLHKARPHPKCRSIGVRNRVFAPCPRRKARLIVVITET